MRAVNLIPREERPGGGRSGAGAYALIAALALVLVMVTGFVLTGNTVADRRADVARLSAEVQRAEAEAAALAPFREFASMRQKRIDTVAALASSRFDWERAMRELAGVLPGNVWLTSLLGTVKPGVSVGGSGAGTGGTSALRGALQVPAIELGGCTESQEDVAGLLTRLRLIRGATRVSLAASEKNDTEGNVAAPTDSGGAGAGDDCRNGSRKFPKFELVIFFAAQAAPAVAPATGGVAPAAQTTATTGGTQ